MLVVFSACITTSELTFFSKSCLLLQSVLECGCIEKQVQKPGPLSHVIAVQYEVVTNIGRLSSGMGKRLRANVWYFYLNLH